MTGQRDARARMLRATEELLREGGWDAATPAAVAARAGAGKMSLYRHFTGKDNLVVATLRDLDRRQYEWLFGPDSDDPRARLLGAFDRMTELARRRELTACPYVTVRLRLGNAEHEAITIGQQHKRAVAEEFTRLLTALGHPTPVDTGRALIMLLDGAVIHAVLEDSAEPLRTASATARTLLPTA